MHSAGTLSRDIAAGAIPCLPKASRRDLRPSAGLSHLLRSDSRPPSVPDVSASCREHRPPRRASLDPPAVNSRQTEPPFRRPPMGSAPQTHHPANEHSIRFSKVFPRPWAMGQRSREQGGCCAQPPLPTFQAQDLFEAEAHANRYSRLRILNVQRPGEQLVVESHIVRLPVGVLAISLPVLLDLPRHTGL